MLMMRLGDMLKYRNHVLLCCIYIFTILFTLYLCLLYRNSSINVDSSKIDDYISDVTGTNYDILYENISNYNDENDVFYIYVSSYKSLDLSSFEGRLKNIVVDNNIKNIIYINADNLKKFDYLKRLISDFGYSNTDISIKSLPIFIVFNSGKITDIVSIYDKDDNFLREILEVEYD